MTPSSPRAFVLVGPTASGKSAVALKIAEWTGMPVVSADSMNIYRGMNIGTAKPSARDIGAVVCYGMDLAEPTESFSVADWLSAVTPVFRNTSSAIVTGGTGLYIKCLLQGLDDLPAADEVLRERAEAMTVAELQAEVQKTAPEAYAELADPENPRRLIRLLEQNCRPGDLARRSWQNRLPTVIGLHVERKELHRRIAARVEKMYAEGLREEARTLADLELSSTAQQAIGYSEAFAVLRGELTEAQAKERTVIRTRQLAKRQMTWFRHQLNVEWIEISEFPDIETLAEKISNVWKTCGPVPLAGVRL